MICSPDNLIPGIKKHKIYVFLAGPIQGGPDWRSDIEAIDGVIYINPQRRNMDGFDWAKQVEWETKGLAISDYILFWIPQEIEHIEGRDYAQTTKIELMENLCLNKNIILGIDKDIHTRRYLEYKFKKYTNGNVCHTTLNECLNELKKKISEHKPTYYFTSDTHFGSDRALKLSKRPFKSVEDMDWTMVRNWNNVVCPNDTVWHLGDFGDYKYVKYLNGNIMFSPGNYEQKEIEDKKSLEDWVDDILDKGFTGISARDHVVTLDIFSPEYTVFAYHEPEFLKDYLKSGNLLGKEKTYGLFGHIHGRDKVKTWGIDVGVDCNNFTPMSVDDVKFYLNALDKGYYDKNVFD